MASVATITGIVGAATGLVALIVSIKSHVRVSAIKALDLRIEVGRSFNSLDVLRSGIEDFLDHAKKSRHAVLAATGLYQSGQRQVFDQDFESDKLRLRTQLQSVPQRAANYSDLSTEQLEALLVEIHSMHLQLQDIRTKYQRTITEDDERRSEIRARH